MQRERSVAARPAGHQPRRAVPPCVSGWAQSAAMVSPRAEVMSTSPWRHPCPKNKLFAGGSAAHGQTIAIVRLPLGAPGRDAPRSSAPEVTCPAPRPAGPATARVTHRRLRECCSATKRRRFVPEIARRCQQMVRPRHAAIQRDRQTAVRAEARRCWQTHARSLRTGDCWHESAGSCERRGEQVASA